MQQELYALPRSIERFRRYLETVTGGTDDIVFPPLVAMNPMGKEHVAAHVAALLDLGAERVVAETLAAIERELADLPDSCSFGIVVADDAQGGWTNRYFTDLGLRTSFARLLRQRWCTALYWTTDPPSIARVRVLVRAAVYRLCYGQRHGEPRTLRQILAQEGLAALFADDRSAALDADDLGYTHAVLHPSFDAHATPTVFAALFGDDAARSAGYAPLGLSAWAGLSLARHLADAYLQRSGDSLVAALDRPAAQVIVD